MVIAMTVLQVEVGSKFDPKPECYCELLSDWIVDAMAEMLMALLTEQLEQTPQQGQQGELWTSSEAYFASSEPVYLHLELSVE
jgi:hypothetical protein